MTNTPDFLPQSIFAKAMQGLTPARQWAEENNFDEETTNKVEELQQRMLRLRWERLNQSALS